MTQTLPPPPACLQLSGIVLYPIKSLPGVPVDAASILPSGGLANDRRWSLVDADGNLVNGKRQPALHGIRAHFNLTQSTVEFRLAGGPASQFHLEQDPHGIESWLAQTLGQEVRLLENRDFGFPDDPENAGPTLVTTASFMAVQSWFSELSLDEVRRRFRFNLEFDSPPSPDFPAQGIPAFWEDGLVAGDEPVPFSIGDSRWLGTNPCQRCAVPTRNTLTGEVWPGFARAFGEHRLQELPPWAPRARFDHGYRLTVNTRYAGGGQRICLGDQLRMANATAHQT